MVYLSCNEGITLAASRPPCTAGATLEHREPISKATAPGPTPPHTNNGRAVSGGRLRGVSTAPPRVKTERGPRGERVSRSGGAVPCCSRRNDATAGLSKPSGPHRSLFGPLDPFIILSDVPPPPHGNNNRDRTRLVRGALVSAVNMHTCAGTHGHCSTVSSVPNLFILTQLSRAAHKRRIRQEI